MGLALDSGSCRVARVANPYATMDEAMGKIVRKRSCASS